MSIDAMSISFRKRIYSDGPALVGTFVIVPRVEVVEVAAVAGFDFVILDCEHGPFGIESVPPLVAAADALSLQCLVRVSDSRAQAVGAALDVGAAGVVVPHVSSASDAAAVVAAARYAPAGTRGVNPYVRGARYSAGDSFFGDANNDAACIAMVEGIDGIAALDEILQVAGLDAILVGPMDISAALGYPGQAEHPRVVEAVQGIIERGRENAVATAVFAPTPVAAARWIGLGVRLVALSVDTALMLGGFRSVINEVRRSVAVPVD